MNIDSSDSTPDLETDHPLHAKQFTGQSYTFYETVALSIKASDIFPNHQNITCNNSSFHDPDVMSIYADQGGGLESLSTDTPSQSSSEEQQLNHAPFATYMSSHASETDFYAERFRDLNDIAYHRSYNNDRLADVVMIGVNVLAFCGIVFLSESMKYLWKSTNDFLFHFLFHLVVNEYMWYFLYHVESMFVNEKVADVYCPTVIVIWIVFHLMYRTFADCVYMSVHSLPVCPCACLNLTIKITIHCFVRIVKQIK